MPVDYSKWDALELSDDSDIEVHPNVDKRSFIRAKQNQIHQERHQRKHRIATLKYEKVINDGLLSRIDALLKSLDAHRTDLQAGKEVDEVDDVVFESLTDVMSNTSLGPDVPPSPPEGVHSKTEQPSYNKMMGALVDQVKSEIEKAGVSTATGCYEAYIKEVDAHHKKVQGLQKDLLQELNKLEREEGSKITSESIHTGFDSSHVSKNDTKPTPPAQNSVKTELLNPSSMSSDPGGQTPGSDADVEDGALDPAPGEDNDDIDEASPLAKRFGKITFGDYRASLQFVGAHPEVLAEKETDGLLVEAFNAQLHAKSKKDEEYARQCVHQALLLQYCRQLGKDGVGLFFKRVQTTGHQARKIFLDDVNATYARIRSRTAELAKQSEEDGERELIQLHAVDPGTTINIVTPPPLEQCQTEDERTSRAIFESFPPGLQRALEAASLEKVNEVLAKMSVDEAEQVVDLLGNGGMLSMEAGVIDATTEEGKRQVEEIERTKKLPGDDRIDGEQVVSEPVAG